jgi:uncharacterized NAD-dependent epimerase/dehydratase family protein
MTAHSMSISFDVAEKVHEIMMQRANPAPVTQADIVAAEVAKFNQFEADWREYWEEGLEEGMNIVQATHYANRMASGEVRRV